MIFPSIQDIAISNQRIKKASGIEGLSLFDVVKNLFYF